MSAEARTAVLQRIRTALKDRAPEDAARNAAVWEAIPRLYERTGRLLLADRLALLEDRLRDYDAEVAHVSASEVAEVIGAVLAARGQQPTLLPQGFPPAWTPAGANLTFDEGFSARQLDHFEGVVTGAMVAIAETGTLVLQNVAGQGRRAGTLVPDFHLCVVRAEDVVETVPEAFARLSATPAVPTTFVSGPSATADIEMTRIKGVHGPRFLHVLIVSDDV